MTMNADTLSSTPPLVGITGPRIHAGEINTTPLILLGASVDSYYAYYPQAVAAAGGLPVNLTREADAAKLVLRLDALVIAGGHDVDPRAYGVQPSEATTRLDPARDRFELDLILAALAADLPLLGICRGAQLMNIARGGTLIENLLPVQDVEHTRVIYPPEARVHPVECEPGSVLRGLFGESLEVNSFHHQGIDVLGEGVRMSGLAPDGTVEAIEIESAAGAVGVQWHPEMLSEPDPLFDWLIEAAVSFRDARASLSAESDL